MTKPILCDQCKTLIGSLQDGMVNAYDNYNVCERCGAEVCGLHCVEVESDYWVCLECDRVAKTTLDETIEMQKSLIGTGKTYYWVAERMYKWLTELRDRRESELRPANRFLKSSKLDQFIHIKSEVEEIRLALNELALECLPHDKAVGRVAEELVDLQMSCETMLAVLGLDEQERSEARRKVIAKNHARGYYLRWLTV